MASKNNLHKAINAKLEILHLQKKIEELQAIVDQNITLDQWKNKECQTVDPALVEAAIERNQYVGHKLIYKDVDICLHTDNSSVERKLFKAVFGG